MKYQDFNELIKKVEEKIGMLEHQTLWLKNDLRELHTAFIESLLQEETDKEKVINAEDSGPKFVPDDDFPF